MVLACEASREGIMDSSRSKSFTVYTVPVNVELVSDDKPPHVRKHGKSVVIHWGEERPRRGHQAPPERLARARISRTRP